MSDEQKTHRRSKLPSSKPEINPTNVRNVEISDVVWAPGDSLDFAKGTSFPQRASSGASVSAGVSSELVVENTASILENPHFLRSQFPFTNHAKIESTSETAEISPTNSTEEHRLLSRPVEDSSSCGQNVEKYFSNQSTSSDLMKDISMSLGVLSGGQSENIQKPGDGRDFGITTPFWNNNVQGAARHPSFLQSQLPSILHERKNVESSNATMNSHSFRPHAQFESPLEVVINPHGITDGKNLLQLRPAKDSSVNDFSLRERTTDKYFSNACSSSDQMESMNKRMELLSIELGSMLQENDRFLSSGREDKRIENDTSSSRTSENHFTQNTTPLGIANKFQQKDPLSLKDISFQYYKLYHNDKFPVYHDYAMNIMAYVEILNDCSWITTETFFDENVKDLVKYIWNEIKDGVDSRIALRIFDVNTFLVVVAQVDQNMLGTNYNLDRFIYYSAIMSQIGVMARKRNIKEAPLYVIDYLRKRIIEIVYYMQISFESYIVKYAQYCKGKFHCMPTF